jgi:hypothetical protein
MHLMDIYRMLHPTPGEHTLPSAHGSSCMGIKQVSTHFKTEIILSVFSDYSAIELAINHKENWKTQVHGY